MRDELFAAETVLLTQLPKRVRVGGYVYLLSLVKGDHESLDGNLGITDFDAGEIYLSRDQHFQSIVNTALHEIQHAINHAYGIEDGVEEETIARQSANGWQAFWLDNPRLFTWFGRCFRLSRKANKKDQRND